MSRRARAHPPPSPLRRLRAQCLLSARFYLGLGAPGRRASYPACRVRAAAGYSPDTIHELIALRRGESDAGEVEQINFRCHLVAPAGGGGRFFVKDFPRTRPLHGLEQALRCSRVDRAWRSAHLLPRLGILTPRAVGTTSVRPAEGPMEYLITEWLPDAMPYHDRLRLARSDADRMGMIEQFALHLRRWHDGGIYLRDLVTNVLTRESPTGREYWLTDLDQLHPVRRLTRGRLLHQMRQLARWAGPLDEAEAGAIIACCLGRTDGPTAEAVRQALLTTPSACAPPPPPAEP